MIDHYSTYAKDYAATRAFYEAVFSVLGFSMQADFALEHDEDLPGRKICAWGPTGRTVFWVIESVRAIDPRHVAIMAPDRAAVDRFHAVGLEAGGNDNGPPGVRAIYHPNYYGSFLLDPDGNNVEAVCHLPPNAAAGEG